VVRLERVTCRYGPRPVLVDVDLSIDEGSFIGVVGPSGSGKTTLLRTITGAVRPTAGTVHRAPRLAVGYVPQVETVNWHFPVTVAEVVVMARNRRVLPWTSRAERHEVAGLLERLGLGGLDRRHILELSGGQQQRVFIARALMRKPRLLLLDEPTSGVDIKTRHELLHLLDELNAGGLTILLTTHDLNGIATHLPTLVCLNGGVIATGAPFEVLKPNVLERTYGAPMEVLEHAGGLMVIDSYKPEQNVVRLRSHIH
jgi:ABC-type Mn2+/Zn2+ transport system ATPase subunit